MSPELRAAFWQVVGPWVPTIKTDDTGPILWTLSKPEPGEPVPWLEEPPEVTDADLARLDRLVAEACDWLATRPLDDDDRAMLREHYGAWADLRYWRPSRDVGQALAAADAVPATWAALTELQFRAVPNGIAHACTWFILSCPPDERAAWLSLAVVKASR